MHFQNFLNSKLCFRDFGLQINLKAKLLRLLDFEQDFESVRKLSFCDELPALRTLLLWAGPVCS